MELNKKIDKTIKIDKANNKLCDFKCDHLDIVDHEYVCRLFVKDKFITFLKKDRQSNIQVPKCFRCFQCIEGFGGIKNGI